MWLDIDIDIVDVTGGFEAVESVKSYCETID